MYGQQTSNIAEPMNSALSQIRNAPILTMCFELQKHIMTRFFKRRAYSNNLQGWTSFKKKKNVRENDALGRRLEVHPSSDSRAFVVHNSKEFLVDLDRCQ